jgi:hypothetical protein
MGSRFVRDDVKRVKMEVRRAREATMLGWSLIKWARRAVRGGIWRVGAARRDSV